LKDVFSSNIIKIPESSKGRSIEEKERESIEKRERKRKAPRVSSNKKGSQCFERRKTLQHQNPFCVSPFSSPPSYHFKNPFQKHLKIFCSSF
jgi:hypothetical protein